MADLLKAETWDHPLIFLIAVTLGVIGLMAFMSWGFASLGWTGPLGLVKGGVM